MQTEQIPEAPYPSIYAFEYDVEILESRIEEPFIVRQERISPREGSSEPSVDLEVAYVQYGRYFAYVGDIYKLLLERGITDQIQPARNDSTVCTIGFNPTEQSWYGWSHRAMLSFKVGDTVKPGDVAYAPKDKADMETEALAFWEIDKQRSGVNGTINELHVSKLVSIEHDVVGIDDAVGMRITWEFIATNQDTGEVLRSHETSHFHAYPKTWGRGEWTAQTLEDAREMAVAAVMSIS